MIRGRRRRGIASVVGMLFMVLVFMAAIGAQVYTANIEAQTNAAAAQAEAVSSQKAQESISIVLSGSSVVATDTGPASSTVVGMVLKFENGTAYVLDASSNPPFVPAAVSASGQLQVQPLVPQGTCTPGTASCLSKFQAITGGQVPGRAVGLVTSLGNIFWYVPSASPRVSDPTYYRVASTQSTTAPLTAVTGLSFAGSANTAYVAELFIVYYQAASSPSLAFAISVPTGSTFMFCGGMAWSNPAQGTTDFAPGNLCTSLLNVSLGPTTDSQTFCTQTATSLCEFTGTAYVMFGSTSGSFQMEVSGSSTNAATVVANSFMVVTPAS